MLMEIVKFEDEDEPFRKWRVKYPTGFVVNVDRGMSDRDGTRIHRADCQSLAPGSGGGEKQTESYIKVCSTHGRELDDWAIRQLGRGLRELRCKLCNPSSLGLS